ncbi:hypothetical protein ACLB2K_075471 [Fragaria x ananassa]
MGIGNGSELLNHFGDAVKRGIPLDSLVNEGITNVGVDTTHWLVIAKYRLQAHQRRGHSLVSEGITNDELHATYFIDDCRKNVAVLKQNGLTPILVFDGNATPLKSKIEEIREAIKDENNKKNKNTNEKQHQANSAIIHRDSVPTSYNWPDKRYIPDRHNVVKWLRKNKIEFFVAPYEADAQLTHLASKKIIDAVITIDSDLIAFGCEKILYKVDFDKKTCNYYSFQRLREVNDDYKNFSKEKFLEMSIMIGCDYLPKLTSIGIEKAHEMITKHQSYKKVINRAENLVLATGVEKTQNTTSRPVIQKYFEMAILAFTYQQVYDPESKSCQRLSHMKYDKLQSVVVGEIPKFLGPRLKNDVVYKIAMGERESKLDIIDEDRRLEEFPGETVWHGPNALERFVKRLKE